MKKLTEAGEKITNPKIVNYFEDCVETLKDLDIMPRNWGNDIKLTQNKALHTFGSMMAPRFSYLPFELQLSVHLFPESEDNIKNTIYHELCHYIQMKEQLEEGILWFGDRGLYMTREGDTSYESPHGGRWQGIAKRVSIATGQNIQRTDSYNFHTNVGKEHDKAVRYILKCKHCGNEFKYLKRTEFIDSVLRGNGHSDNWWCKCRDGYKSHDFEIIKAED